MPHYFFNLHHEGNIIPDEDGQYERTARDAWNAARGVARYLIQIELERPINWQDWHFTITEQGSEIEARLWNRPPEAHRTVIFWPFASLAGSRT
jgi:hypothetical protein